jgi:uncharacterized membrane protein
LNKEFYSAFSLALFIFGLIVGIAIFIDVQIMNGVYHIGSLALKTAGYPWWTERVTEETCFLGQSPDDNCGFLNYGQALIVSVILSFAGFFSWLYLQGPASRKYRFLRSLGLSLLLFGLLIAAVVYIDVQVMNGIYQIGGLTLKFDGFPYGGQEVFGAACIVGTNQYHCSLFSYDELLFLGAFGAFVGLILYRYSKDVLHKNDFV